MKKSTHLLASLSGVLALKRARDTYMYSQTPNISHNKSRNLNVSCLALQMSLPNPFKLSVKLRMKMWLEQRRHAMLQLHLSGQQFYCLLSSFYIRGFRVLQQYIYGLVQVSSNSSVLAREIPQFCINSSILHILHKVPIFHNCGIICQIIGLTWVSTTEMYLHWIYSALHILLTH